MNGKPATCNLQPHSRTTFMQLIRHPFRPIIYAVLRISFNLLDRSPKLRGYIFDASNKRYALAQGRELFVVSTKDKAIGRGLYRKNEFDLQKVITAISLSEIENTPDQLLLVDIGANIGSICIPAIKRGLATRAYAIEPEPKNINLLRANVNLNGLGDVIEIIPNALGREKGTVPFELSEDNYGDHRIKARNTFVDDQYNESHRDTVTVEMTTLDDILQSNRDENVILWMDTQGYEGFVLGGASETLKKGFPLVLEFWPYGMKRSSSYEILKESIDRSPYTHYVDLNTSGLEKVRISIDALDSLYEQIGDAGKFTDILLMVNPD